MDNTIIFRSSCLKVGKQNKIKNKSLICFLLSIPLNEDTKKHNNNSKLGRMLFCLQRKSGVNEDEEEDEEEELGHTDTYAEYVPSKCKAVSYVF